MYAQAQARLHRSGQRGASVSMVYLLATTGAKQANPLQQRRETEPCLARLVRECEAFDSRQWARVQRKARAIAGVMSGDVQLAASASKSVSASASTSVSVSASVSAAA